MSKKDEALKLALEALEGVVKWDATRNYLVPYRVRDPIHACITAIRSALAEQPAQQQEPVAEVKLKERGGNAGIATVIHEIFDPMREPLRVGDKLYTSPPASKPLTDEQISDLWDGHTVPVFGKTGINPIVFARAIEAAHGIKEK